MVKQDFNQANALISRLMENIGGSANAYEDLPPEVGPVVEEPKPRPGPATKPLSWDSRWKGEGDCHVVSAIGDDAIESLLTQPWEPIPISEDYVYHGIVESTGELKAVYYGLAESLVTKVPREVVLDTGVYTTAVSTHGNWELKDTVKDRLYCQEKVSGMYEVVKDTATFVWVMTISNRDTDLGYIHDGYVYLHK